MCRYAQHVYKPHYACFKCRKVFRKPPIGDLPSKARPAKGHQRQVSCPDCGGAMVDIGMDFKAPPKADVKQWRKVEILYENGFAFQGCGCDGGGYRPKKPRELKSFIEANTPLTTGQRLLKRFKKS